MVKVEYISQNLVLIIQELIKDQTLCKYLFYDQSNPLTQTNLVLPATSLIMTKIFPYPFDVSNTDTDESNLRIYYPEGDFINNQVIENINVWFDIVVAKKLWLVNDGSSLIRPYEIMKNVYNALHDNSISTVGRVKLKKFRHVPVNSNFDCIRLFGEIWSIG